MTTLNELWKRVKKNKNVVKEEWTAKDGSKVVSSWDRRDEGLPPAIHIEGGDKDMCKVTISHCVISRDGFAPLTREVKEVATMISLLGLVVALGILVWVLP